MSEKENSEFKPVKICLKIDLVSYPARAEGLVNMYMNIYLIMCSPLANRLSLKEMYTATSVQIMDEAVCFSL